MVCADALPCNASDKKEHQCKLEMPKKKRAYFDCYFCCINQLFIDWLFQLFTHFSTQKSKETEARSMVCPCDSGKEYYRNQCNASVPHTYMHHEHNGTLGRLAIAHACSHKQRNARYTICNHAWYYKTGKTIWSFALVLQTTCMYCLKKKD